MRGGEATAMKKIDVVSSLKIFRLVHSKMGIQRTVIHGEKSSREEVLRIIETKRSRNSKSL